MTEVRKTKAQIWQEFFEEISTLVQNPSASPATLAEAAQRVSGGHNGYPSVFCPSICRETHPASALLGAIVSHPNTPIETLLQQVNRAPIAFCRNPVAPLLLLEQPTLLAAFTLPGLRTILRNEQVPAVLLEMLLAVTPSLNPSIRDENRELVRQEVELHIVRAGECADESEWRQDFAAFWSQTLEPVRADSDAWRAVLDWIDLGLVPPWVLGQEPPCPPAPLPPADALTTIRHSAIKRLALGNSPHPGVSASLLFYFHFFARVTAVKIDTQDSQAAETGGWRLRLATCLSHAQDPSGEQSAAFAAHARDANRLVRFAARQRLSDPAWSIYS